MSVKQIGSSIQKLLPETPSILISAGIPTAVNSIPGPETGTLGCVLPGFTLQLNGEPGTGWPLNLRLNQSN